MTTEAARATERDWTSQTVVVTGAASGLGAATCARFASLGARVVGVDLRSDVLAAAAAFGGRFRAVACDVSQWTEVERTFAGLGPVDVLVNSAGITGRTSVRSHEADPDDVRRVFAVNFFGSYHTSRAVLAGMVARGYGRVLHIASIAGKEGNAGMLAYSSSKAAVIGMAKVQGKELAGTGVTVNALAPAVIRTPMVEAMPPEQVKYMTDKIPMQRCGTLDELVAIVEFIVSPACSFTTGFTFDLSGGRATY
ncbi:MAG TPA: SDR family oxidoreductase [Vicinamibacteria bacterium]|nr:SDR family oxidoreductase [Vicinamibacteria bacterium]